jgi:hypothetical protein
VSRLFVVALLVALAACSGTEGAPQEESGIEVSLGFTQLLPDEGTPKGLLRVVNEGDEPLAVTGAGLRWSGYGPEFTREQDATIAPGQTLDLRVLLPDARCDKGKEPILGVVSTAEETQVQPLTESGQQFLRRLWLRGCRDALVAENVKIAYAPGWRIAPGDESLDGTLRLTRQEGSEPVTVVNADGSVLYDLVLPREVTLAADASRVDAPLSIRPGNRCDEHAIGQATAPFTFRIGVRVGDGPGATETLVLVTPPVKIQKQAGRMLLGYCERKAG